MTPAPLDEFLTQMAALLDGRKTAQQVEQVLGKSASGTQRLGLYATLVERQQRGAIDGFYQAAQVASDTRAAGQFAKLRDAFLRKHPAASWSPARACEQLGPFLAGRSVPIEVRELVDFGWTRHWVLHAPQRDDASGLAVRHYTHGVRDFSHQVERERLRKGRPRPGDETWLMGRARSTAELVILQPSVAALVAVQVLTDGAWSDGLPAVSGKQVVEEAEHLRSVGLLAPSAVTQVAGWVPR